MRATPTSCTENARLLCEDTNLLHGKPQSPVRRHQPPALVTTELVTNMFILSTFPEILGSFCAEDFLYLFDVQEIIGQYEF